MVPGIFVTGTDTGVGKTVLVTRLLRQLREEGIRAAGFKPICCGDRGDAERILAESAGGFTLDEINPCWLRTPAAPFTAAQIEKREVAIVPLLEAFRRLQAKTEVVVVEGVGGWLVPLGRGLYVADLAAALALPVIVVVANRLGCLNHAFLTLAEVERRGLSCAGMVCNRIGEENVATATNERVLGELAKAPPLPFPEAGGGLSREWRNSLGFSPPV